MKIERFDNLDSKELDTYRNIRTTNLTRFSGRFIAESRPLVSRLIASDLEVESVLLDEAFLDEASRWIPDSVRVLVVPSKSIPELIGFNFHRGYLACGIRPTARSIHEFADNWKTHTAPAPQQSSSTLASDSSQRSAWTGVMLLGVQDPENMGSILRSCAALGISDIFIGPNCVDPFARRVLRVSMGNAFKLHFVEIDDMLAPLTLMKELGIESLATCLADDSEELSSFRRNGDSLILFGNEAHGLPLPVQQTASRRLKIAMDLETDSLNVSVAAGIILHNLCRIC